MPNKYNNIHLKKKNAIFYMYSNINLHNSYIIHPSCIMISIAVLMCTELFFSKYLFGNNHSRRNAMRTVVNNKHDDNSGGSDKRNNNNNNSKRKKRKHL